MSAKKKAVTGTDAPHWSEKYELVVGLAVHAQLITQSKAYSSDPNAYGDHPNVLGGGLAGLTAAYELQKAGFTVTVLEGRDRVGGRVWTVREGFQDGQYAEIGAARIGITHKHVLAYAEEFGIGLAEFPDGEPLYFIDGQRFM